jgi:hypothetical protein
MKLQNIHHVPCLLSCKLICSSSARYIAQGFAKVFGSKVRLCFSPSSDQAPPLTICLWLQIEAHNAAQMAMLQGMRAAGNSLLQADTLMQPAGPQQASALGLPFSPQPSTPIPPVAFNAFASTHPSACKPAPYRPYRAPDPGLQSMASSSDDGMRMAEGCFRLLAI